LARTNPTITQKPEPEEDRKAMGGALGRLGRILARPGGTQGGPRLGADPAPRAGAQPRSRGGARPESCLGLRAGAFLAIVSALLLGPGRAPADTNPENAPPAQADTARTTRHRASRSSGDQSVKRSVPKEAAKAKPRTLGPFTVTGSFDFQAIYDDNIFRYSNVNLLRWRKGDYRPGEFDLDTYDDLILSPRLNLNLTTKLVRAQEAAIRLSYIRWQYASNPAKSNESWAVRLRQRFSSSSFTEIGYTFAPMALIRPLGDRAPFDPFSTVAYGYYPFRSTRNAFSLALQGRPQKRLTLRLEGGRVIRYYNQRFIENDNWEWNAAAGGNLAVSRSLKVNLKYTYSRVLARGADTVGETRQTSDDGDPSYKRDLYQAGWTLTPRRAVWVFNVWDIFGQYQAYYFTSKRAYWDDPTHVGRKDEVWAGETSLGTRPVWGPVTLELGYRYATRSSSSGAVGANLEEDKNYHNNRVWLGMSYPF
jgi:hypothetical protein